MQGNQTTQKRNLRFQIRDSQCRIIDLLVRTAVRAVRFPVMTVLGALLVYVASVLTSMIPGESHLLWFVRTATGFSLGYFIMMSLAAIHVMRLVERPDLFVTLRSTAIAAVLVGIVAAIPVWLLSLIVPDDIWLLARQTWVYEGADTAIVLTGAIWVAAACPALLIAWPLSIENAAPLTPCLLAIWRRVENKCYSPFQVTLALCVCGALFLFVPALNLLVIPLLAHMQSALYELCVQRMDA